MYKLTPVKLIASLSKIPLHCILIKNGVGNLAIMDESKGYIGFVDLTTGEVELDEP